MNERLMTKNEFLQYAQEVLFGESVECLFEQIAEIQGEINRFGDSGPGSCLRLRASLDHYNGVARQFNRLTGSCVKPIAMVVHPYFYDPEERA
jgi:hypothetical protein